MKHIVGFQPSLKLYKVGTPLVDMKLRGERKISCFANDCYFSLDDKFKIISRNIFSEHKTQMRFYPQHKDYDPNFVELWANGVLVARVRDLRLALNWIILKVRKYS